MPILSRFTVKFYGSFWKSCACICCKKIRLYSLKKRKAHVYASGKKLAHVYAVEKNCAAEKTFDAIVFYSVYMLIFFCSIHRHNVFYIKYINTTMLQRIKARFLFPAGLCGTSRKKKKRKIIAHWVHEKNPT